MRFLSKLAVYLLVSVVISFVMMVVSMSLMTGKFPPDLNRISTSMKSLKQLAQLGNTNSEVSKSLKKNQETAEGFADEADAEQLLALNSKRAQLGAGMLGNEGAVVASDAEKGSASSSRELAELRKMTSEMQTQLFKLQQRVAELEADMSSLQKKNPGH
jgi:hypothetical protein